MDRYLLMRVNVLDVALDSSKFEKGVSDKKSHPGIHKKPNLPFFVKVGLRPTS